MKSQKRINIHHLQLKIAEGNQSALKELYNIFGERLLHFAYAIIHTRPQAEEIVADVFIQIWQKRERIAAIENFTWYLYTITKNISLNYLRKENKLKHINIDEIALPYYTIEPAAIDQLVSTELLKQINKAINDLPLKCRLIFRLIKEEGLQYKEVAELLNLNIKTVENQMGIALKKLHSTISMSMPLYFKTSKP